MWHLEERGRDEEQKRVSWRDPMEVIIEKDIARGQ
jgi:hypothetical protein